MKKKKWNKTSEYYCEIFSLYVNELLDKEDRNKFKKFIEFNKD